MINKNYEEGYLLEYLRNGMKVETPEPLFLPPFKIVVPETSLLFSPSTSFPLNSGAWLSLVFRCSSEFVLTPTEECCLPETPGKSKIIMTMMALAIHPSSELYSVGIRMVTRLLEVMGNLEP